MSEFATKEERKEEAVKRMKAMGLMPKIVGEFRRSNKLYYSENVGIPGILYWLTDDMKKVVKDFEKEYEGTVYHIIKNYFEFGEIWSIFYVSKYKEEWSMDWQDIKEGYATIYGFNATEPMLSELGSIGFRAVNGGLERTA